MTSDRSSLFFTASASALPSIEKRGILPPNKVHELINSGELERDCLGMGYNLAHYCETPSMVSLESRGGLGHEMHTPEGLGFVDESREPAILKVSIWLRNEKEFINEAEAVRYASWPGLVLYKGIIPNDFVVSVGRVKSVYRESPDRWSNLRNYVFEEVHWD